MQLSTLETTSLIPIILMGIIYMVFLHRQLSQLDQ